MPYANWTKGYDGLSSQWTADINIRLLPLTGIPPLVGANSLEMFSIGNHPNTKPQRGVLTANCTGIASAQNLTRGRVRTLFRVFESVGPVDGRMTVGVWAMFGTTSRIKRHGKGRVLLCCDGGMHLAGWDRVLLWTSADVESGIMDYDLRNSYAIFELDEAPYTRGPASVTALELEWYVPTSDDFTGTHLIGRVGENEDFSDLVQVVQWTSVDSPDVINPAANSLTTLGIVTIYDSWPGELGRINTIFDQTCWDRIDSVPNVTARGACARIPYKERKVPPEPAETAKPELPEVIQQQRERQSKGL